MLSSWFYHERIRKTVAVFGSLFNNLYVVRHNSSGEIINQTKVPLSYAPRRDFLDRIQGMQYGEDQERQIAIKLPRMSFEIVAFTYDATRQLPKVNNRIVPQAGGNAQKVFTPVPYEIQFQLNVYARSQDDALQIVEQILPTFTPQYTVTVKPLEGYDISEDTPIKLEGVTFQDDYEGAIESRRTIIYTLDFSMKINLYKAVDTASSIIRTVETSLLDFDTGGLLAFCKVESNVVSGDSADLPYIVEDGGGVATSTLSLKNTLNDIEGYEIITQPNFGTAAVDDKGVWTYTPNPDAYGEDSFVIGVDVGQNVVENITIQVNASGLPGVDDTVDDSFTLNYSGTETLTMNVASNDLFETVGDITHTVQTQPAQGTVTIIDSLAGTFLYTPPAAPFGGTVTWQYRAIPDGAENSAEVGDVTIVVTDTSNIDDDFANVVFLVNAVDGESSPTTYASDVSTFNNSLVTVNGVQAEAGLTTLFQAKSMEGNGTNGRIESTFTGTGGVLGAGDFTMEGWFYTLQSGNYEMASTHSNEGVNDGLGLQQIAVTHEVRVIRGFSNFDTSGTPLNLNAWNHVAVTREGTDLRIFVNGVLGRTVTNDTQNYSSNFLQIMDASRNGSGSAWEGFIEDFRITKGVARYTANFSVPTQAFPTS